MNTGLYQWDYNKNTREMELTFGDKRCFAAVEQWGSGILRLLIQRDKTAHRPPFLLGEGKRERPNLKGNGDVAFESGKSRLVFSRNNGWQWFYQEKPLLEQADELYPSFKGWRYIIKSLFLDDDSATISFGLQPGEPVFGGGETFGYLNKRRLSLSMRILDSCGLTTTGYSYKFVPLFWSPRGWAVFACTNHPVIADIGNTSYTSLQITVKEPCLDIFLIPGSPGEIMRHYWRLTGTPPLPPEWALGVWWSRCMYQNLEDVKEVVDGLKKHRIRGSVISLDPLWQKNKPQWNADACDFIWNDEAFGDQKGFCDWLHGEGFKLCLWENPYVWLEGDSCKDLKKYLLKDRKGDIMNAEAPLCGRGIVEKMEKLGVWDFTDSRAWEKRKTLHKNLLKNGADCFKVDYGDGAPGEDLHNVYAFYYVKNTWEAAAEERGEKEAMIWARPGWSGCQRYPGCWAGDSQSTFPAMASTLAGCLSLAASGVSWWSHDIGGFFHYTGKPPSPELYIRWAEMGLLSPLSRFHGTTPREPWRFGEEAVKAIRKLADLRYELIPQLMKSHHSLVRKGLPMGRPLVMDYPEDPATWDLADEYLLGESYLVAPVLEQGAQKRKVYFPEGAWALHGKKTKDIIQGPCWRECPAPQGIPLLFEKI
jgi:alpha-D-xyloside xylohydrolase